MTTHHPAAKEKRNAASWDARRPSVTGLLPDITIVQITAIVGWAVAQAVAYGWLDIRYQQVTVSAGATIVAAVLKLSDAIIRNGRAKAFAANPQLRQGAVWGP
jgi:hypothetical protein